MEVFLNVKILHYNEEQSNETSTHDVVDEL